jgi:hypothetical protein
LEIGLRQTYHWIKEQYDSRKLGDHTARSETVGHSISPLPQEITS